MWIPRVIKEALRLYPPGWLYTRRALGEDRFGDYLSSLGGTGVASVLDDEEFIRVMGTDPGLCP